jgi:excisionase family DNA binding protein
MTMNLTVKQVAAQLACSEATVYGLCNGHLMGHLRLGIGRGTIRISEEDLAAFMASRQVRPCPPVNAAGLKHIKVPSGE